jgi:hypothetical protein
VNGVAPGRSPRSAGGSFLNASNTFGRCHPNCHASARWIKAYHRGWCVREQETPLCWGLVLLLHLSSAGSLVGHRLVCLGGEHRPVRARLSAAARQGSLLRSHGLGDPVRSGRQCAKPPLKELRDQRGALLGGLFAYLGWMDPKLGLRG